MKIIKKICGLFLLFTVLLGLTACDNSSSSSSNSSDVNAPIEVDGVIIDEAYEKLVFNSMNVKGVEIKEIKVDEIVLKSTVVNKIENIEIALVPLNDEMVYIAYQNLLDYYGAADIDYKKLFTDMGITIGCTIVIVGLSFVGGPLGTFFGAVLTSEFAASTIVIGAAIDAAIAGVQAYKEGGDFEYIFGHILNGVADGMMFGAIFAPISGAFAGVKAIKAAKQLSKIPGFDSSVKKGSKAIFENFSTMLKATKNLSKTATDAAITKCYKEVAEELSEEITENIFKNMFKNRATIQSIIQEFDPFGVASKVIKTLKQNFIDKSNIADNALSHTIRKIQSHLITGLEDIDNPAIKKYLKDNMYEFLSLFSTRFNKQFVDNLLKASFGNDLFEAFKNIYSPKAYFEIISKFGKDNIKKLLNDPTNLLMLQIKFGADNLNKFLNVRTLFDNILLNNKIPFNDINHCFNGILDGSFKSLDDISKLANGKQIVKNIQASKEVIVSAMKGLKVDKKSSSLIQSIVTNDLYSHFRNDALGSNGMKVLKDIVENSLNQQDIITKYGQRVFDEFIDKIDFSIQSLSMLAGDGSSKLIDSILKTKLKKLSLADDTIQMILKGTDSDLWKLDESVLLEIGGYLSDYYKHMDVNTYANFITKYADLRAKNAAEFVKDFNSKLSPDKRPIKIINGAFAGKVCPTTNKIIKEKYGDILFNEAGFPIFDKFATARVVVKNLTGDSGSDIALANLIHHGTTINPAGYTWHHLEDGKTLILIPQDLHKEYLHTGGANLIANGLKEFKK